MHPMYISATALNPAIVRAYSQTHYGVRGASRFSLRIGRHSAPLQALHRAHNVHCSAYITACNPYSQSLTAAQNAARHAALLRVLRRQGLAWVPGVGRHLAGNWPGERSVLVLGLELDAASVLGIAFRQNAIVWNDADAVPQLVLLR